jgi:hypothetical protein
MNGRHRISMWSVKCRAAAVAVVFNSMTLETFRRSFRLPHDESSAHAQDRPFPALGQNVSGGEL